MIYIYRYYTFKLGHCLYFSSKSISRWRIKDLWMQNILFVDIPETIKFFYYDILENNFKIQIKLN